MILLDVRDYKKAEKPLREVGFNTLFAESVIHGKTPGQVYADDEANPSVFYVVHPYGMSLLFGAADKPGFNQWLQQYLLDKARSAAATNGCRPTRPTGTGGFAKCSARSWW